MVLCINSSLEALIDGILKSFKSPAQQVATKLAQELKEYYFD